MKTSTYTVTNTLLLIRVVKAFLRGICTQEELDNRVKELGFDDKDVVEVMEEYKSAR